MATQTYKEHIVATLIKFSNSAFLVRFYKNSVFTPAAKIKYISFKKIQLHLKEND